MSIKDSITNSSNKYDEDVVIYGMKVIGLNIITVMTILITAYLTQSVKYGVFYICSLAVIRVSIGGFHCKTMTNCLISMVVIYLLVLNISKFPIYVTVLKCISLISIFYLIYLSCKNLNKINLNLLALTVGYIGMYIGINNDMFNPIFTGMGVGIILHLVKMYKILERDRLQ